MKPKKIFAILLFTVFFIHNTAFASNELIEAYKADEFYPALSHAYQFKNLQGAGTIYDEIVNWMDNKLLQGGKPTILHNEQPIFQPILEWPMFSSEKGLVIYIGFLYYLGEHAQSTDLKKTFLQVLARTDKPISPVLKSFGFYWQQDFMETALKLDDRTLFIRIWSAIWDSLGNLLLHKARERHAIVRQTLEPYGDYFLKRKSGHYTYPYKDAELGEAISA